MITLEIRIDSDLDLVFRLGHLDQVESVLTLLFVVEDATLKEPCNRT